MKDGQTGRLHVAANETGGEPGPAKADEATSLNERGEPAAAQAHDEVPGVAAEPGDRSFFLPMRREGRRAEPYMMVERNLGVVFSVVCTDTGKSN